MLRIRHITMFTAAATALAAGLFGAGTAGAQDKVTIGITSALSGPLSAPGKFQMNGFRLAEEEINAAGGVSIGGRRIPIELKVYDTRGNPGEGASAMQRLATVDNVPVVLGELSSGVAAAMAPIAEDNELPLILTVPTGPSLTQQGHKFLFRVNANNAQLNRALAEFLGQQGWSPVAFIAWNNDAGRGGVNGMKSMLAAAKDGYVGYFNVGEVDFSSHVSNIRASKAQAVMLLMDEEPGSLAIRQIRDAGLDVHLVGTLAMGSDRFLKRLDAQKLAGMVQYNAFPPNADVPRIKAFSARYKAKYGEEAHGFAAQSYDGLKLAVAAMEQAGTVTDRKAIREALAKIQYDGVIGRVAFGDNGQASPPVYVTQWCEDGKRRILFPESMKAGCGAG
ncbi:MAG: ABC transporter substrate-binding protein [Burkholderiales bacterium]|nr:MAG: ABC transporter substrate-binding protein [Burkholderiales bacterium]